MKFSEISKIAIQGWGLGFVANWDEWPGLRISTGSSVHAADSHFLDHVSENLHLVHRLAWRGLVHLHADLGDLLSHARLSHMHV